jgi:hypothetical protein
MSGLVRCAHLLALLFGFWLVGTLLSVQLLLLAPPATPPPPPPPLPSVPPSSPDNVVDELSSQLAQVSQLLALKRTKLRRLATRARIVAEADAERAAVSDGGKSNASVGSGSDQLASAAGLSAFDAFLRRIGPPAHARMELFRRVVSLRSDVIRADLLDGPTDDGVDRRRHGFCIDHVPWCYAPVAPAPPLPPADADDLKWLELELAQLNRSLTFAAELPPPVPSQRTAIFTLTSGRSGTQYFRHLLGTAANVSCFKPALHSTNAPISAQDPINCTSFFREPRQATQAHRHDAKIGSVVSVLTHFRMPRSTHYCEVNPVTVKAWSDVLVGSSLMRELVDLPTNFVVLRRNMALTVKSMVELRWLDESPERCPRMMYDVGEPASFLARCDLRNGKPDGARWDVIDRTIAHLFDVEARTQAMVLRALRLEAARRVVPPPPPAALSARARDALRGATNARVFEVCLEQLSPEAITAAMRADNGTLDDMLTPLISARALRLARKNIATLLEDMQYQVRSDALEQITARSWTNDDAAIDLEGGVLDMSLAARRVPLAILTPEYIQSRIDAFRSRCTANGVALPDAPHAAVDGCSALTPLPISGTRVWSPRNAPYNRAVMPSATKPSPTSTTTTATTTTSTTKARRTLQVVPPINEDEIGEEDEDQEEKEEEEEPFSDDGELRFFESDANGGDVDDAAALHEQQLAALNAVHRSRRLAPFPPPPSPLVVAKAQPPLPLFNELNFQALRQRSSQHSDRESSEELLSAPIPPLPPAPHVRSSAASVPALIAHQLEAAAAFGAIHAQRSNLPLRAGRDDRDVGGALADLQQAAEKNRHGFDVRRAFERLNQLTAKQQEDETQQRLRGRQP